MKYNVYRTNPTISGIDSIFNDIFGDNFYSGKIPPVDVYETAEAYALEAEVAGYNEKDISISVEKHVLTVACDEKALKSANAEAEKAEKKNERKYLLKEISRPSFSRSFTLPEDVDEEAITAETKDGILKIQLPKTARAQRGRIEIKIN